MKKILTTTFLLLLMLSFKNVSALEDSTTIINSNNISISEERLLELMDAGYTLNDIYEMTQEEYDNVNIYNPEIAMDTKYLKTTTTTKYGKTIRETIEVSEEEYNNAVVGAPQARASGVVETSYKKLISTIDNSPIGNSLMRYRTYMHWKTMPVVRSYDIISMGFSSTYVNIVLSPSFTLLYTQGGYTYRSSSAYVREFVNGAGAVFQLPSNCVTLNQDFFFDVAKNDTSSTITVLNSFGDYAHATETVNPTTVNNNYTANMAGIFLNSSITNKFDAMTETDVTWTGTW